MPKNKLSDLRDHLFETLEALKDEEKPMDVSRAKAVAEVAQVIINTAKLEIDFAEVANDEVQSDFMERRELGSGSMRALPGRATA